jgi:hypothetical protein
VSPEILSILALLSFALPPSLAVAERVVTHSRKGHLMHHSQVFSRDGHHIVFDYRTDETRLAASTGIGMVNIRTGEESEIYRVTAANPGGPGVGAATFRPVADEVIFIHGLDNASEAVPYAAHRRSAARVALADPGKMVRLDARDVTPPFTPGALRGGTHAHHWSGDGTMVSFTYNDAILPPPGPAPADLRTIGVTVLAKPVTVDAPLPGEEFSGAGFSVLVVRVTARPAPGSDEISRAYEEGWVGINGYLKADGSRQAKAIAFIGNLVSPAGELHAEVFIADLPADLSKARPGRPLEGSATELPSPPAGVVVRRLTRTGATPQPGLQGPRHWVRPSPDGGTIAFLDEDEDHLVQIFGISPNGGAIRQLSRFTQSVDAPFSWSPCGKSIACSAGERVHHLDVATGKSTELTRKFPAGQHPRHGTVFSPDGSAIAFNRLLPHPEGGEFLQVCLVELAARDTEN